MPFRPLDEKRKAQYLAAIEEAKELVVHKQAFISYAEQLIRDGVWSMDKEAFKKVCEEAEREAGERRLADSLREIMLYGRELTENEKTGFATLPPVIDDNEEKEE